MINPNRQDDVSGQGYLCAAGVTMIFIAAVNRRLRQLGFYGEARPEPNMLQWLELVALATVCDVVPLKGLNRAYVTQGLKIMARRENPGLSALADIARLKRKPDTYALGFLLGPRINAAGRVGNAGLALELLTTRDRGRASQLAQELEKLNRERQAIELAVVDQAAAQAEAMLGQERLAPVLVVARKGWHPGVVGLAAARLKERFNRPAFVLAEDRDGRLAAGSGRSIAGVDLGATVRAALEQGIIVKGGGHGMAAGLTLEVARLGDFRAFLTERLAEDVARCASPALAIDAAVSAGGASLDLIELLEQAGPFGSGNPAPVFAFPAHRVVYADAAGTDHIRLTLAADDGKRIKAIAFRAMGTELGELLLSERRFPLHVAGRLTVDDWSGSRVPCAPDRRCRTRRLRLARPGEPPYRAPIPSAGALRLSVRTAAFHVAKTGSTPVGRAISFPYWFHRRSLTTIGRLFAKDLSPQSEESTCLRPRTRQLDPSRSSGRSCSPLLARQAGRRAYAEVIGADSPEP